jgi:hypothetical protein
VVEDFDRGMLYKHSCGRKFAPRQNDDSHPESSHTKL